MSKSGSSITYGYNADGKRISKTVNGTTYNFSYLGDQLTEMTWGSNKLHFTYDSTGPASVTYNGNRYFYLKNAQGDVTGLVNASGTQVVSYTYDPWGAPMSTSGTMASTLGTANPLRYRGYVYDTETGLYYLSSRYYNPAWGRFINADTAAVVAASPNKANWDKNLFAYCDNNPISRKDDGGEFWHLVVGAAIGGIIGAVSAAASGGDAIDMAIGFLAGAGGGALAASGAGVFVQAVGGAAIAMTSNAAQQANKMYISKKQESFDVGDMLIDGAVGLVCGAWGGNGASYGNSGGIMAAGKQLFKRGFFNPQARSYYAKTAHRLGGDYVFKPLLESLGKSSVGTTAVTIKNIVRACLK
ncbi:MAG: RHS repeat-associated core domain-containing protein [Oscillospiraceae bacterium]